MNDGVQTVDANAASGVQAAAGGEAVKAAEAAKAAEQAAQASRDAQATDAAKAAAAAKALSDARAANVPEKYSDFTRAQGIQADAALMTEAQGIFKELGLNQAESQKLVAAYDKAALAAAAEADKAWNTLQTQWKEASAKDTRFGGEKFEENKAGALHALKHVGGQPLVEAIEAAGYTDHPEIINLGHQLRKLIGDDTLNFGKGGQGGADALSKLFPTHNKQ